MPFDSWLMNCNKVTVTNFEECIKIFKRRIVELRKEVATTEALLREQIDPEPLFDTESSDIVYVYHQLNHNCVRYNHPTESVTVLTIDIRTRKNVNVNAYYCKRCKRYFINSEVLNNLYHKKSIYPLLHFRLDDSKSGEMHDMSELRMYGYSVKVDELTTTQRQSTLAYIIENQLMTKEQIINILEFLVHFNGKRERNLSARLKWEEDIIFVSRYTHDNSRRIKAKFVRRL